MIAIGHTSIGVILGVAATEILPAVPLPFEVLIVGAAGVASHYAMDLVPHGHYNFNQQDLSLRQMIYFGLDFAIPILFVATYVLLNYGFERTSWLIGAGILGAQLPDMLMGLRSKKLLPGWDWLQMEAYYHHRTHWHNPVDLSRATNEGGRRLSIFDVWQAFIAIAALFLLFLA